MSLSGDIRDGHLRIGEWSAERQPGTGGVHPYLWGVKLSSGPLARGVVVHDREDGTLGLVIKVLAAAVQQFGGRDHPEVPTAQAGSGPSAPRPHGTPWPPRWHASARRDCPESECPTCTEEAPNA